MATDLKLLALFWIIMLILVLLSSQSLDRNIEIDPESSNVSDRIDRIERMVYEIIDHQSRDFDAEIRFEMDMLREQMRLICDRTRKEIPFEDENNAKKTRSN